MTQTVSICARAPRWRSAILFIVLVAGCRSTNPVGGPDPGSAGGNQGSFQLPDARTTGPGGTTVVPATGDANCGISIANISQQPVDLLIVLDRSTSMTWDMSRDNRECAANDSTCQQRWSTVTRLCPTISS